MQIEVADGVAYPILLCSTSPFSYSLEEMTNRMLDYGIKEYKTSYIEYYPSDMAERKANTLWGSYDRYKRMFNKLEMHDPGCTHRKMKTMASSPSFSKWVEFANVYNMRLDIFSRSLINNMITAGVEWNDPAIVDMYTFLMELKEEPNHYKGLTDSDIIGMLLGHVYYIKPFTFCDCNKMKNLLETYYNLWGEQIPKEDRKPRVVVRLDDQFIKDLKTYNTWSFTKERAEALFNKVEKFFKREKISEIRLYSTLGNGSEKNNFSSLLSIEGNWSEMGYADCVFNYIDNGIFLVYNKMVTEITKKKKKEQQQSHHSLMQNMIPGEELSGTLHGTWTSLTTNLFRAGNTIFSNYSYAEAERDVFRFFLGGDNDTSR